MKNQITIKALGLSAIIFLLILAHNTALACCPCETNINTIMVTFCLKMLIVQDLMRTIKNGKRFLLKKNLLKSL